MGLDLGIEKRRRNGREIDSTELTSFRKVNFLIPLFEKWLGEEINNCEYYPIDKDSCLALLRVFATKY